MTEFCDSFSRFSSCNNSHTHIGRCNVINYGKEDHPPQDQRHFWHESLGGDDEEADYCSYVVPLATGDCRNEANSGFANTNFGEKFGPNSVCIEGDFAPTGSFTRDHGACHEIVCRPDGFDVKLGDSLTVSCGKNNHPEPNDVVSNIKGFAGSLNCPSYDIVCGAQAPCPNTCSTQGSCTAGGVCDCMHGFYGTDCLHKCHNSCHDCSGPEPTDCESCKGTAVFDQTAGTCTCNDTLDTRDGNCFVGSCPKGTELSGSN
jgi:hypothetical protein